MLQFYIKNVLRRSEAAVLLFYIKDVLRRRSRYCSYTGLLFGNGTRDSELQFTLTC